MSIQMGINEIIELLPHRYPFLLIDRVLEMEPDKHIVALKNVTINEPFFPGHYPHHPVMPGVLIIEAMAQAAALLSFKSMGVSGGGERRGRRRQKIRILFCGHRWRAFQAAGRPGRPIDHQGHTAAQHARPVQVQRDC